MKINVQILKKIIIEELNKMNTSKDIFLEKIIDTFINNEDVLIGILEEENAELRRYGSEPYKSIAEFKQFDLNGFNNKIKHKITFLKTQISKIEFGNHGMKVYRALVVTNPKEFLNNLQNQFINVGKYWSFSIEKAIPYWKRNQGKTIILKGELPITSIDFKKTIIANTTLAFSSNENEITAIPNTQIYILEVLIDKINFPINHIQNI